MASKELDALVLNNAIVKMRKVVNQSRYRVSLKIIRRMKALKKKKGTDIQKQANLRKVDRLLADLKEIKSLKPADVSKSALVNTRTVQDLEKLMCNGEPTDRALYRLIGHDLIRETVDEFREKYPDWPTKLPFLLQRLGLQYKMKKNTNRANKIAEKLRQARDIESDSEDKSGTSSNEEKSEKKTTGFSEKTNKSTNGLGPKFEEKMFGTTVVQKIDMTAGIEEETDNVESAKQKRSIVECKSAAAKPSSSFFVGGKSDSEEQPDSEPEVQPDTLEADIHKFQSQFSTSLKKGHRTSNIATKSRKPKDASSATIKPHKNKKPTSQRNPVNDSAKKNELDESNMHPSWLAKRKMKETLKMNKNIKNKKIKFD